MFVILGGKKIVCNTIYIGAVTCMVDGEIRGKCEITCEIGK